MDEGGLTPWLISALLILFADYIAVCETALASASKVKMKTLAEHGNKKAVQVLDALEHFDRTISAILILTNIAHLATASLVTVAVTRRWGLSAVTVSTILTSLVVFFFGEMLPKSIAKKYSNSLALWCIGPLSILVKILTPGTAILAAIGNFASRFTKGDPEISVTEDEIHDIIDDMTESGTLDEEHGDLISSALEFNDITVESILTPRVDVTAIDINDDPANILEIVRNTNHSRLPVYDGSIDNIIGILRIRRYLRAYIGSQSKTGEENILKLLDEPLYVTESAKVDEILPEMSAQKQNIAIVSDHFGGTAGIVTVEDIVESLVGEIWDEEDEVEDPYVYMKNGNYMVDAEETVEDAFEFIGFKDPENDESLTNKRLGEWVYEHFSMIPKAKEHFEYHGLRVYVARMDHNRIRKVMIAPDHADKSRHESENQGDRFAGNRIRESLAERFAGRQVSESEPESGHAAGNRNGKAREERGGDRG
ncbi:MAG: hemolysin family protein [Lachnospiraceae bacterium]|nr:hemolysin family protein [Lachnospiraceae bacterium]